MRDQGSQGKGGGYVRPGVKGGGYVRDQVSQG